MPRRRIRDLAQQVLDLDLQSHVSPVIGEMPGLIDAVAALLLAAVGAPQVERSIKSGGVDEQ